MADEPVAITKAPTVAVMNLATPTYDGDYLFTINWDVPSPATDDQRDDRFEGIYIRFEWDARGSGTNTKTGKNEYTNVQAILDYKNLNRTQAVGPSDTSVGYYFDKTVFYPEYQYYDDGRNRATLYAKSMKVSVYGYNSYGTGPEVSASYSFYTPKNITFQNRRIVDYSYGFSEVGFEWTGENAGVISITANLAAGNDGHQRVNQDLTLLKSTASSYPVPTMQELRTVQSDRIHAGEDDVNAISVSYDDDSFRQLTDKQWIMYEFRLHQSGYAGDQYDTVQYYLRWPPMPVISSVKITSPNYDANTSGEILVSFRQQYSDVWKGYRTGFLDEVEPPITFTLQILKNSTATTAVQANNAQGWEDVSNMVENSQATAFIDTYANARPTSSGKHVWYRIVATRIGFTKIGLPVEAAGLFRPQVTAQDLTVTIANATATPDGLGISMNLGWNDKESEDPITDTGVEVSWSDYEFAWESNEQPSTMDVTWEDGTSSLSGYAHSAKAVLRGLSEGTAYYVRARRYGDFGNGREFGPYAYLRQGTEQITFTPVSEVKNLELSVPQYLLFGQNLYLSWGYECGVYQTDWVVNYTRGNSRKPLASGKDTKLTYTTITWDSLTKGRGNSKIITETNSTLVLDVSIAVASNSNWTTSQTKTVTYRPLITSNLALQSGKYKSKNTKPDIPVYTISTQPIWFTFSASYDGSIVAAKLYSLGNSTTDPDGHKVQPEGEVIWSGTYKIQSGSSGNATYNATTKRYVVTGENIFIPITRLWNKCNYALEITATDPELESNVSTSVIHIRTDWSNVTSPLRPPSRNSTVQLSGKTALIRPVASSGGSSSDRAEIYRVTPDGAELVLQNGLFGTTYEDKYVPYSNTAELKYRIATRTLNNQVDWLDIPYTFGVSPAWRGGQPFYTMSFDWGGDRHLEVPYNLSFTDGYAKSFERRANLDGTASGWWNKSVSKTKSLKTVATKFTEPDQIALIRELAQYPGAVFVRTPDGDAFAADVQVSSIDNSYDAMTLSVSFKATAITLPDEFKIRPLNLTTNNGGAVQS